MFGVYVADCAMQRRKLFSEKKFSAKLIKNPFITSRHNIFNKLLTFLKYSGKRLPRITILHHTIYCISFKITSYCFGFKTLTLILQRNLFKQIDGTSSSLSREVRT